ncbi:SMP-30/gluconolactonase/LRE family protein [Mycobacterium xenopi]|uniref:Gluconolactonase n=1 Tax=Mycobacterium xenopi TaxID=1789 RepID=A0AAD1GXE3_MYCXE|nr:SMP-30/gluconolactonase/LRE family protein [Mycobacterium xenopi]MDA3642136.1 SMP-30/gluconolactonase/LRE family protein [Mycobacterium xenopi]MDA3658049.1 SMP-30/gluconolactonase/LRE family protein [Mycobacterium xenopi]MDA3664619.1 SMP-30/gluconolactonase/LRE family protein [Mycobacterium xenopi]SPX78977.1 SMP-30/gluconolaconase/LRE domain-containing protein [Mycobacterium xenopi]BBU21124.1 gluconolactonase [Mycobacterium xenopi]
MLTYTDWTKKLMKSTTEVPGAAPLVDGLLFPEAPRWRAGQLWFSDMIAKRVCTADLSGTVATVAQLDEMPGGIGFLPDGTPLVVAMTTARLLTIGDGCIEVYAELGDTAAGQLDDMAVATDGTAYVGAVGRISADTEGAPPGGAIVRVAPDRAVSCEAENLAFPNGAVLTAGNTTLLVNETFGERITAFNIGDDGRLMNRRTWAALPGLHPDGLALDERGATWVGCYLEQKFVRVLEGGRITDVIRTSGRWATGVELGGPDGRTLFLLTADTDQRRFFNGDSRGRIDTVRVEIPAARP